jgi:hypothetical protein
MTKVFFLNELTQICCSISVHATLVQTMLFHPQQTSPTLQHPTWILLGVQPPHLTLLGMSHFNHISPITTPVLIKVGNTIPLKTIANVIAI